MHPDGGDLVDQSFTPPPAPVEGSPWPSPTRTAYPMKPSGTLLDDGRLVSGALDRVKANQHEQRVIVRWTNAGWVVARPRLARLHALAARDGGAEGPWFCGDAFDPEPEQWGLRGDPYVWAEIRDLLDETELPATFDAAVAVLHDTFHLVVGVELNSPQNRVFVDRLNHGGMSGGWVDLETWRDRLMPLLEARLGAREY